MKQLKRYTSKYSENRLKENTETSPRLMKEFEKYSMTEIIGSFIVYGKQQGMFKRVSNNLFQSLLKLEHEIQDIQDQDLRDEED